MPKKAVLSMGFDKIDCAELKGKKINHFKVKVPKYKTGLVKGNTLNSEAKSYISIASVGDVIALFDVTLESEEKMSPVMITLIE